METKKLIKQKIQKFTALLFTFLSLSATISIAMPATASAALCDDISKGTGGFFSCGKEVTSFTEFTGTLSTPDSSQYAPGLRQNQNLRDYIKNVVNFALGFLGLLAVVVVIYGGFMYVSAAGNEDQAGKGKKAITYAMIGILIILSSFALVNTILLAGGGSDNEATKGSPSTSSTTNRKALFSYAGTIVQSIARDFVTAYQNYSEIKTDLTTLANVDAFSDSTPVSSGSDFKTNLQQKRNILTNIISKSGALSQVAEKGQAGLSTIDKYIQLSDKALQAAAEANEDTDSVSDWFKNLGTNYGQFKDTFDKEFGQAGNLSTANETDFAQAIVKAHDKLNELYRQLKGSGASQEINDQFKLILGLFKKLVPTAASPTITVSSALQIPANTLVGWVVNRAFAESKSPLVGTVDNATVLNIVNSLSKLYELVKDLEFVYAVITVDKTEGNAPLPVAFDGLKSLDPNNNTIDPAFTLKCDDTVAKGCYKWDFGDGTTTTGASTNHTFEKSGTYIVKLEIIPPAGDAAKGQKTPGHGIAYQTIVVHAPSTQINLNATIGTAAAIPLSKYNDAGQPTLPLTVKEASTGVTFDASQTNTGGNFRWDFGNKENPNNIVAGKKSDAQTPAAVTYNKEGTYHMSLEVTDIKGDIDRKFVDVVVSPVVARFTVTPSNTGDINQEFTFDGSSSASDASPITKYDWTIQDEQGTPAKNSDGTTFTPGSDESFKFKFSESGTYTVKLVVETEAGNSPEYETTVKITSKPPVAQFAYTNSDPTHPNIYTFDGTASYDPDGGKEQKLGYNWEVNPADCTYYKWVEADAKFENTFGPGTSCSELKNEGGVGANGFSKENSRIKFKFNTKNKYTVRLDVQDSKDVGNSVPMEQDITVDNILDVGWPGAPVDDGLPIVCKLGVASSDNKCKVDDQNPNKNNTKVSFTVFSENGATCEIDTGDGKKEVCNNISHSGGTPNITTVSHTYTEAGNYKVKVSVYDAQDNGNATFRKVYIAGADQPMAAFSAAKNGENIDLGDPDQIIDGNRKTTFTFDATPSINVDGTHRNLNYSWDFGDGTEKSTKKTVTHVFADANVENSGDPNYVYTVSLTVSDQETGKKSTNTDRVFIHILKEPPVVGGLVAVPATGNATTPVQVNVSATSSNDPDGKIVSYKWWYEQVQPTVDTTQMGVQITTTPSATLTIGTNGEENEKHTYKFNVVATDNEGKTNADLNPATLPTIQVVNGPNKAPIAKFSVDRTNVYVCPTPSNPEKCDVVNFSSSSSDPDKDGKIEHYMWSFEGFGYTNPGDPVFDKANVTYVFSKPAKDGIQVRLKVRDNNGTDAVSEPVKIFVDSKANPPTAAFTSSQVNGTKTIKFVNNSVVDEANGAKLKSYAWDFNVAVDSNGDGKADNDIDSPQKDPSAEYPDYGIYRAKLTVNDDQGGTISATNFVNVKAPTPPPAPTPTPGPTPTPTPGPQPQNTPTLDARLLTTPGATISDGKVHLQGDSADVTFDFSGSTGNIKSYVIDKNIYFDTNGNGVKDDDEDYKALTPGKWTTGFSKSFGAIRVRLTVVDAAGKKDTVDKDIVFDTPPAAGGGTKTSYNPNGETTSDGQPQKQLSAFVLAGYEVVDWQLLLVSLASFGIFIASSLNKNKHARIK